MAERILMANTTPAKLREERLAAYKEAFLDFLAIHHLDDAASLSNESEDSIKDLESPQTVAKLTELFLAKINDPNWKKKKKNSRMEVAVLKDKRASSISVRADGIIDAPLEQVSNYFYHNFFTPKYETHASNFVTTYKGGDYREMYIKFKFPFPLADRDFSLSEWLVSPDKNTVLIIRKSNKNYPEQPGIVRAKAILSGTEFTSVEVDGVQKTRVRIVIHTDPKGSVPKWLVNTLALGQAEKLPKLKKDLESKNYSNKDNSSEYSSTSSTRSISSNSNSSL